MEIKKKVILRNVAGEYMLVPVGETVFEYNGIFMLTSSGKQLWEKICDGAEAKELVDFLIEEYGIDKAMAENDVAAFIARLESYGIV